jgi:hypothetical protein
MLTWPSKNNARPRAPMREIGQTKFVALPQMPYRRPRRKPLLLRMLGGVSACRTPSRALLLCSLNWEGGSRELFP